MARPLELLTDVCTKPTEREQLSCETVRQRRTEHDPKP